MKNKETKFENNWQVKGASLTSLGGAALIFGLVLRENTFLAGFLIGASLLLNVLGIVYFTRMISEQKKG